MCVNLACLLSNYNIILWLILNNKIIIVETRSRQGNNYDIFVNAINKIFRKKYLNFSFVKLSGENDINPAFNCRLNAYRISMIWVLLSDRLIACECAGWSGSMLVANALCWFCRDATHILLRRWKMEITSFRLKYEKFQSICTSLIELNCTKITLKHSLKKVLHLWRVGLFITVWLIANICLH
jgi:hypothetical protein